MLRPAPALANPLANKLGHNDPTPKKKAEAARLARLKAAEAELKEQRAAAVAAEAKAARAAGLQKLAEAKQAAKHAAEQKRRVEKQKEAAATAAVKAQRDHKANELAQSKATAKAHAADKRKSQATLDQQREAEKTSRLEELLDANKSAFATAKAAAKWKRNVAEKRAAKAAAAKEANDAERGRSFKVSASAGEKAAQGLTDAFAAEGGETGDKIVLGVSIVPARHHPESRLESGSVGASPGRPGDVQRGPYFHPRSNEEKAKQLLSENNGLSHAGKFMFWSGSRHADTCLLSVVFREKITHHTIIWDLDSGSFHLDGQQTGFESLVALQSFLKYRRPELRWPVPLTIGVEPVAEAVVKTTR